MKLSLFLLSVLSLISISTALTLDELNHKVISITAEAHDCIKDYDDLIEGRCQDELSQVKASDLLVVIFKWADSSLQLTQECANHLAASYDRLDQMLVRHF